MALPVTDNLDQALDKSKITPVLVMEIDGYDTLFGNIPIRRYIRIGDPGLLIGNSWVIGGFTLQDDQSPYITFNTGTTTKITQKLDPSRGLGSSVTQMAVSLIDRNFEVLNLISPGFQLEEILGRFATIYLGLEDTAWPEDYNIVFQGVIEHLDCAANTVTLYLNNTEEKKRAAILTRTTTNLTADVNFRSVTFQDLFFKNEDNVTSTLTVTYIAGGTAGSEVVTVIGNTIQVQIENGVSKANQIKKAIEDSADANPLVIVKVTGTGSNAQVIGSQVFLIDSTINVDSTDGFFTPADSGAFTTFLKINNELIEYTGLTATSFTGCTRAELNTVGNFHETDDEVLQIVRFFENPINAALKLMLSGGPTFYAEDVPVQAYVNYSPSLMVDNAVFFNGIDVEKKYGVSVGDLFSSTGSINPLNDLTDSIIAEVGVVQDGSYIILNDTTYPETASTGLASFKSPYNKWPVGLKMLPKEVDVKQHLFIRNTFLPLASFDAYERDIPIGKTYLETECYKPYTCFSVPRKGRSSIVIHVGPLPTYEVVQLNDQTVINPQALKVERSLSENFFNQVEYNYNHSPTRQEFDTTLLTESAESLSLIPVGDRPFKINSHGLRTTSDAEVTIERASERYLKRYERGAEFLNGIQVSFKIGYQIEIGDIVAVDYAALRLGDFSSGDRNGTLKLMEVLNKTLDNKTGQVSINVVNTIFQATDRFGLISPASITDVGSTTTKLRLKKSYGTRAFERESNKYSSHIGQPIIVHTEDYSIVYDTFIRGFDNQVPQGMSIDAIPTAPGENWIVNCPYYPDTPNTEDNAFWKQRYAFFAPQVQVVSGISQTVFEVDVSDIDKFFVSGVVRIHSYDYTDDAPEAKITDVDTGTNYVTIDTATGFTITSSHYVDLIGFSDHQHAYRII